MCGRYVSPESASIERQWQLRRGAAPFPARYNVAPGTAAPVLFLREGGLACETARWGLVPHWWTQARPPRLSHNARSEEARAKPLWRDAMRATRALMPAIGWYEWRERDGQPYYFFRRDGGLAAFAALYSLHGGVLTCALLTAHAQAPLDEVHDRMPVALGAEAQRAWLESGTLAAAPASAAGEIGFHSVRKLVNTSRAEGPELIEPLAA
jgi:putative SOS response-associated peptidase YedK